MKILHVSDLHARPAWFKWLIRESSKVDLVCISGDLLDLRVDCFNGSAEAQIKMVLNQLSQLRAPFALCSGNHDSISSRGVESARWTEPLRKRGGFIDGSVFWFQDYKFRCVPWGEPLPVVAPEDFWLIHAPPLGVYTSQAMDGSSHGCNELREVCRSAAGPLFALSGHVHSPRRFWGMLGRTISLNPGWRDHPFQPSSIIIDMSNRTVTHRPAGLLGVKNATFRFAE